MKKRGGGSQNAENKAQLPQWDKDWNLQPMNTHGLVDEYLEMGETLCSFWSDTVDLCTRIGIKCGSSCWFVYTSGQMVLLRCEPHFGLNCSFPSSSPVWLHHYLCGGVPTGSPPGTAEQHHRDPSGRLQVCDSVEETHACPSHWHWSASAPTVHTLCRGNTIYVLDRVTPVFQPTYDSEHPSP